MQVGERECENSPILQIPEWKIRKKVNREVRICTISTARVANELS